MSFVNSVANLSQLSRCIMLPWQPGKGNLMLIWQSVNGSCVDTKAFLRRMRSWLLRTPNEPLEQKTPLQSLPWATSTKLASM
jgi:hypothetical protein